MADENTEVSYDGLTAEDTIAPYGASSVDADAAKRAEDAGVVDAAYVNYETALQNYEARSDVETLEDRRARENGTAFSEANFVREGDSLVATSTAAGAAQGTPSSPKKTADSKTSDSK